MRRVSELIWVGFLLFALLPVWPTSVAWAEVNLRTELTNEITDSTLTDKETGDVISTDRNRFDQIYNLDIMRQFFPNLTFRAGGVFQSSDERNKTDGELIKNRRDTLHPSVDLNLGSPIFTTGLGYETTEIREVNTNLPTTKETEDQFHGRFLWAPVDFPRFNMNYTHSHRYDDQSTIDQQQDDLALNLRYDWKNIFANYSYTQGKTDDMIRDLQSNRDAHDGRINFNRDLTENLTLNAGYRVNYATDKFSSGGQTFLAPILPSGTAGFYLLDDSDPINWDATIQTSPGGFLADGVKSGRSDINLGLDGDETKNISFGLDFGFSTDISTLRVWVDQDATEVANAFAWRIFTSDDRLTWTQQTLARPVNFVGGIDSYFEITLTTSIATVISARYVKVVTVPLSTGQDPTGRFRELFVTELEAFSLEQGDITRRNFDNTTDMGLLWRINPKTTMGYNVFYRSQRSDQEDVMQRNTTLSQTVNLNRIISKIFSSNVRGSRENRNTPTRENLDYTYGASFAAGWIDTFKQTLSYTGNRSETDEFNDFGDTKNKVDTSNSVLLRNVAQLYRGWSANLDLGYSWSSPSDGGNRYTKMFRTDTSIIPNPKLTMNAGYTYSHTISDQPPSEDHRVDFSAAFSPTTVISLFTRQTIIKQSGKTREFQEYSIDWSPFPDGTLQLFLGYNETLTTEGNDTKSFLAGFDWRMNSVTVLRTSFSDVETESETTKVESQVISTSLRFSL